jgi:hypothetical protein
MVAGTVELRFDNLEPDEQANVLRGLDELGLSGMVGSDAPAASWSLGASPGNPLDALATLVDRREVEQEVERRRQAYEDRLRQGYRPPHYVLAPPPPEWLVILTMPLGLLFTGLMGEAGKDAYLKLKNLVKRVAASRRTGQHRRSFFSDVSKVQLRDKKLGVRIHLREDLPDEAYQQLASIKLPSVPFGAQEGQLLWNGDNWELLVELPDLLPEKGSRIALNWTPTAPQWELG